MTKEQAEKQAEKEWKDWDFENVEIPVTDAIKVREAYKSALRAEIERRIDIMNADKQASKNKNEIDVIDTMIRTCIGFLKPNRHRNTARRRGERMKNTPQENLVIGTIFLIVGIGAFITATIVTVSGRNFWWLIPIGLFLACMGGAGIIKNNNR